MKWSRYVTTKNYYFVVNEMRLNAHMINVPCFVEFESGLDVFW